ncbi:MAG: helix-hairpin-helix domain-containing protein, partial [Bacteroidota bacterium]
MKKIVLLIWLLFFSISLTAQEDIRGIVEEVVDNLNDRFEEGTDFTEITDRLYDLANRKVNVNSAKQDDLSKIPFLSSYQINQLLQHRSRYGKFETIYEMDAIEGFDRELLRLLEPFISFQEEESTFADGGPLYLNHDIFYRTSSVLQEQKGYLQDSSGSRYQGDKLSQYMRYIIDSEVGEVGMTADKDPGEPFFKGHNAEGFDFYSAHLYYESDGLLNKVALGDYSLQYGQGLNMWTGFTMGKSTSVSGAKKAANGIRPYRSATEGGFFRGAAVGLKREGFSADVFFSSQNLDGNRVFNADSSDYSVSSIDIGGYHRTENETEDENSFKEIMYGAVARYRSSGLHFGVTAWRAEYSHNIIPQERLYNRFRFSGDEQWIKGADFSWVMKKIEWYAEASLDTENDFAWLAGANFYLHPRLTTYLFYRDYDKKYNNLYASAAGEYSNSVNEKGLLYGVRFDIHENWYLNSYIDFFSSEWLNYRSETPSSGKEMEARLSYIPQRDHSAYLKFFYEEKVYNNSS